MTDEAWDEIVVFEIERRHFGVRSLIVREVLRATSFVALPHAPPIVEGIVNVRGQIAAVIDIRQRFGLPPRPMDVSDHMLIAHDNERLVAIRADRVLRLARVRRGDIVSADSFIAHPAHPHERSASAGWDGTISGVVSLEDGMVLIHDLSTFLSAAEAQSLDQAMDRQNGR
jgi:purine-binding chemotaxis protein CheW